MHRTLMSIKVNIVLLMTLSVQITLQKSRRETVKYREERQSSVRKKLSFKRQEYKKKVPPLDSCPYTSLSFNSLT